MKDKINCVIITLVCGMALLLPSNSKASTSDNHFQKLLILGKYVEIEDILYNVLQSREKDNDGRSVLHTTLIELTKLSSNDTQEIKNYIDLHLDWAKLRPNSHFANACLGIAYVHYAWNARTNNFAHMVSKTRKKLFRERIVLAATYLLKAYELDPSDPAVPIEMITVAMVHPNWSDHRAKMEEWFQLAIKSDPTDLKAYRSKLNFLHPNWGGSYKDQLAFSRETLKNAPTTSMAPWILTKTHWGISKTTKYTNYFAGPEVWSEMKETYIELEKRFPQSLKIPNWFARTACRAGDFVTAKEEFSKIGDDWYKDAWINREQFDYFKKMTFLKNEKKGTDPIFKKKGADPIFSDPVFEKKDTEPIFPEPILKEKGTFPDPVFSN